MKRTITVLFAALVMTGFASCMSAGENVNENPMAVKNTGDQLIK